LDALGSLRQKRHKTKISSRQKSQIKIMNFQIFLNFEVKFDWIINEI
jgi:hypothetical protein